MSFTFRCRADHAFKAEGKYSEFDRARRCVHQGCEEPAYMIVEGMPGFNASTMAADRENYFKHNITFTGGTSEIQHKPNEQALQCQCDGCIGHRKRAKVTEVAEPMRANRRVAKEMRV